MSPEYWERIMKRARWYSENHHERVRVRGCILPPRAAAYLGTKWVYVVDCVSTCACRSE